MKESEQRKRHRLTDDMGIGAVYFCCFSLKNCLNLVSHGTY